MFHQPLPGVAALTCRRPTGGADVELRLKFPNTSHEHKSGAGNLPRRRLPADGGAAGRRELGAFMHRRPRRAPAVPC